VTAIIPIFRKDLRHLWPQAAIFLGFLLVGALTDPAYARLRLSTLAPLAWTASMLACWNLAIAVVHQERLVGDHQSWRTLPYPLGALLAAKLLFLLVCVNVPLLLMQAGVQAAVGIPLLQQPSALLWRQFFITVFVLVPSVAIAATTRSLRQAIVVTLVTLVSFQMSHAFSYPGIPVPVLIPDWTPSPSYWLTDAVMACVSLTFGSAILYVQYFRRAPFVARMILAGGIVLSLLAAKLEPLGKQVALQNLLSSNCAACGAMRVSLDLRARSVYNLPFLWDRGDRMARVALPIRVEGLPAGLEPLIPNWPAELWCQGRRLEAVIKEYPPGQSWLAVDMHPSFSTRYMRQRVDLDGSMELILFARRDSLPVTTGDRVAVPGVGVCGLAPDAQGSVTLQCYTPARQAALALEFPGGGKQWLVGRSTVDEYSPSSFQFAPLEKITGPVSFANTAEFSRLRLITEQPAFHIRTRFHIGGIRLWDYPRRG
jgi:hypothetical protein